MSNKLLSITAIIVLFAGVFALLITVVNAKTNFLPPKKPYIIVTLNNDVDIDKAKEAISKIPQVKIIKIQDRNKEWSKMVNKMDLPKMDNPFKNEFTLKTKRNADTDEIFSKIKELSFVEDVKYEEVEK